MTISHEQAEWFKATFDQLTDNMEKAVLGKRHVVRLALTCLLSEGHVLIVRVKAPVSVRLMTCSAPPSMR